MAGQDRRSAARDALPRAFPARRRRSTAPLLIAPVQTDALRTSKGRATTHRPLDRRPGPAASARQTGAPAPPSPGGTCRWRYYGLVARPVTGTDGQQGHEATGNRRRRRSVVTLT